MEILHFYSHITSIYLFLQTIVIISPTKNNVSFGDELSDRKRNSNLEKGPLSTSEHLFIGPNITELPSKLATLIIDAEYREARNRALSLNSPPNRPFFAMASNEADDRVDKGLSKVHVHHLFPPAIVRPIQRLIAHKIKHKIKHNPFKKAKKILLKKAIAGAMTVGMVASASDIIETAAAMKDHRTAAKWHVTGYDDLSSDKRHSDDDYSIPKDYILDNTVNTKHRWPFKENENEIYEKWNKFPRPTDPPLIKDPEALHDKLKLFHHTLHEIHPTVLHIVHDIHSMLGHNKLVVAKPVETNSIKDAILSVFKLLKFADKLIPVISVRIPLIDEIKKLAHFDRFKKVAYKVKYVPSYSHKPVGHYTQVYDSSGSFDNHQLNSLGVHPNNYEPKSFGEPVYGENTGLEASTGNVIDNEYADSNIIRKVVQYIPPNHKQIPNKL